VINDKIQVKKIGLRHHDQDNSGHYSRMVSGQ